MSKLIFLTDINKLKHSIMMFVPNDYDVEEALERARRILTTPIIFDEVEIATAPFAYYELYLRGALKMANREILLMLPNETQIPIQTTIQYARERLDPRKYSIYLVGSLAGNRYISGWSDIDIDVILWEEVSNAQKLWEIGNKITEYVRNQCAYELIRVRCYSPSIINTLSLPDKYGTAHRAIILLDHAELILGEDIRHRIERPTKFTLCLDAVNIARSLIERPDSWWFSLKIRTVSSLIAKTGFMLIDAESGNTIMSKREALEKLLSEQNAEIPADLWVWVIWALACHTIPLARQPQPASLKEGQMATKKLIGWVYPILKKHLERLKTEERC